MSAPRLLALVDRFPIKNQGCFGAAEDRREGPGEDKYGHQDQAGNGMNEFVGHSCFLSLLNQ